VNGCISLGLDKRSKPCGTDLPPGCILLHGGVGQSVVKSGKVVVQLLYVYVLHAIQTSC